MSTHLHVSFDIADTESNQKCQMHMREKNWRSFIRQMSSWSSDETDRTVRGVYSI